MSLHIVWCTDPTYAIAIDGGETRAAAELIADATQHRFLLLRSARLKSVATVARVRLILPVQFMLSPPKLISYLKENIVAGGT